MGKLSNLFGRPSGGPIPDIGQRRLTPDLEPLQSSAPRNEPMQALDEIETGSAADAGARLGEENEVLRNLLSETERKLIEFDDLKVTFAALLGPAGRALRTLEQEKTRNLGLQRS